MKIGLVLGGMPAKECAEVARLAEEKGIESVWVYETLGRDAITVLTSVALNTKKVRLGTGLLSLVIRTPTLLAMTVASLDEVSAGRMNLGVGVSYERALRERHGITSDRAFSRLKDYIAIIRLALTQSTVDYDGAAYKLHGFSLGFTPFRNKIPIFIGAHNPKMLELSGELADGVLLNLVRREDIPDFLAHIQTGATKAGRRKEDIEVASYFNVCMDPDPDVRRKELSKRLSWFLRMPHIIERLKRTQHAEEIESAMKSGKDLLEIINDELIDELCLNDTPNKVLDRLQDFSELGIDLPIVFPTPIRGDVRKGYEALLRAL